MTTTRRLAGALAVTVAAVSVGVIATTVQAAPPGDDEVVAFEVRGVGNGHGRGLSQWGAYGRALAGQTWQQILAAYYGGTKPGTLAGSPEITVKLNALDGVGTVGVMSTASGAQWRAAGGWSATAGSIYVEPAGGNTFDVYTSPGKTCATSVPDGPLSIGATGDDVRRMQSFLLSDGWNTGPVDGQFGPMTQAAVKAFQKSAGLSEDGIWASDEAAEARLRIAAGGGVVWTKANGAPVAGPIEFRSASTPTTPDTALGLCDPSGALVHYRGVLRTLLTSSGHRTVNQLAVEDYLRGVVPKEVSPGWGDDGGGRGAEALRAQAVAARSYGVSQSRYSYAGTCDSPSCQVYGGAARRTFPGSTVFTSVEHPFTDAAIVATSGVVRRWTSTDAIVSTEFSASNGPRTAGGAFTSVDDPWDDVPGNPNHRWTRIIDADAIRARYGLGSANGVVTAPDADSSYDGIWANEVRLGNGSTVSAWDFRNAFGLPAPGFELVPIRRTVTDAVDLAFIGDSIGMSVADGASSEFRILTEGSFGAESYDSKVGRTTQEGIAVAADVPLGTDIVIVELGYNDDPAEMSTRIDAMMTALRARQVGLVLWTNVSERRTSTSYPLTNAALAAATSTWGELVVLDWNGASDHDAADRWFSDGVHLTSTGQAEFARWLRDEVLDVVTDGYTPPRPLVPGTELRVPVMGRGGVPSTGAGTDVVGVALNVTAVGPVGPGFLRVWPCGSPEPETSSVNFVAAGAVEPNAVVVPVDASGEVCVSSLVTTDVIVDLTAWFDGGLRSSPGERIVDTRYGIGPIPAR